MNIFKVLQGQGFLSKEHCTWLKGAWVLKFFRDRALSLILSHKFTFHDVCEIQLFAFFSSEKVYTFQSKGLSLHFDKGEWAEVQVILTELQFPT